MALDGGGDGDDDENDLLLPLTGEVVGGDDTGLKNSIKYLLAGDPAYSPSRRSEIYAAYRSDANGEPIRSGPSLAVKVSANRDAMMREDSNYRRVTGGFVGGQFVKRYDFFADADGGADGGVVR